MMGERHTDTLYHLATVEAQATQVLTPVNRKRYLHLDIELFDVAMFVGDNSQVTPLTGRMINPIVGLHYALGPDKPLYACIVGWGNAVLHITEEDSIDAGLFTDSGSGTETALGRGGRPQKDAPTSPRPGTGRAARR
jgi:hypothetical protein